MSPPCIACGANDEFFEHLCQICYLESNPILKEKKDLELVVCLTCGLLAFKGHWSKFYINDLNSSKIYPKIANFVSQEWKFFYRPTKIEVKHIQQNYNEDNKLVSIIGIVEISASPDPFVPLINVQEDFTININWGDCSDCQTRLSGLYISKLQIRFHSEVSSEELEKWSREVDIISKEFPLSDGKNPLFRLIQINNGLDALFRSKSAAHSVGRNFARDKGGLIHITTEFAGFDKSKSKEYPRKQVVLITLPRYREGDYIVIDKQVFKVEGYSNFKITCFDVMNKTQRRISIKSFEELDPKPLEMNFEEYQIIHFETAENLAEIMRLSNYDTQFVDSKELSVFSEGDSFWGIVYEGKIILKDQSEKISGLD